MRTDQAPGGSLGRDLRAKRGSDSGANDCGGMRGTCLQVYPETDGRQVRLIRNYLIISYLIDISASETCTDVRAEMIQFHTSIDCRNWWI